MINQISCTVRTARKDHECMAGIWIREGGTECLNGLLTFTEWRAIAELKANGWKIKKGQKYHHVVQVEDGEIYSFRFLPEISRICRVHEIYSE